MNAYTPIHEVDKLRADNARLLRDYDALELECASWKQSSALKLAEIVRLTDLLAEWENHAGPYKDAEIARLRACRTELDYVFEYYTHGLRPLDLRDWYNRACAALKDTTPQPEFTAYGPTDDTA